MNYKLWFVDYVAGAILLLVIFYWWDSAPPFVLWIAAAAFVLLVFRVVARSWKGFAEKSRRRD
jgi:uncharacterized membrane protein YbhN (UPF0104 family)